MKERSVGSDILEILGSAEREMVLVAPFVKAGTAAKLLEHVGEHILVEVYTRWRPEEVAEGVSDLEVFDLLAGRGSSKLFLVDALHGKAYCTESRCFVTSANVSDAAFGWRWPSNIEVGLEVPRAHGAIRRFESSLRRCAVPATEEIRALVERAAEGLRRLKGPRVYSVRESDLTALREGSATWLPSCLVPAALFDLYRGWDIDVSREAAKDGFRDLEMVGVPPGLSREAFEEYIRALLLQHPFVARLISGSKVGGVTEEDVEGILEEAFDRHLESAAEAFTVSVAWVRHFFGDRFEVHWEEGREILSGRTE